MDAQETQWVEAAVAGEEPALERLLLRHHKRLLADVAQRIPSDARAAITPEDVAQEAYIVVFRRISEFRPDGEDPFFRWVRRIAEFKLMDMLKARRVLKRGGGRTAVDPEIQDGAGETVRLLEMLAVHSRTPSRSAASHEAALAVSAALERLKPAYREALCLRYVEALPVQEVAQRMQRTEGAVLMLCQRALRKLHDDLGDSSRFLSRGA